MMAGYSCKVTKDNMPDLMPQLMGWIKNGVDAYGAVNVELTKVTRTLAQNALFHAQISEIAKQTKINGAMLQKDGAKESLVLMFAFEKEQSGEPLKRGITWIPSKKFDGGLMPVPPRTSDFDIDEGGEFIEYLFMYGAERNVRFNDDVTRQYEEYMRMVDG